MILTNFSLLTEVVRSLGIDQGLKLDKKLSTGSVDFDPDNVLFGISGLYYVDPSGSVLRVVVHIVDNSTRFITTEDRQLKITKEKLDDDSLIPKLHKYHLTGCSTLAQAERQGWRDKYKMSRRRDGTFFYRIHNSYDIVHELQNQRLLPCKNCLNSISKSSESVLTTATFNLNDYLEEKNKEGFSEYGLQLSEASAINQYSEDWFKISRKYKKQRNWICEECGLDCSDKTLQRFLESHHQNMDKSNNCFANLKAVCIRCHSNEPMHSQIRRTSRYKEFLSLNV